jgi:hypothetical protein
MTQSGGNGPTRADSAAITRRSALAHRKVDVIGNNFGHTVRVAGYRKTLAL